ncbi:MAG: hypothetical protein JWN73_3344 [Betaproteobacteria bacterium]|nr:hypothetical protein [Betaproteobacteria bacterium]
MQPTHAELSERFESMSDEELQRRAGGGGLTELAQQVADEELRRRGMAVPAPVAAPAEQAAQAPTGAVEYVMVGRYFGSLEAQTLRGRLEAEGIPVLLGNANHAQAIELLSPVIGGIRLEVPVHHAAQARALLEEIHAGKLTLETVEGVEGVEGGEGAERALAESGEAVLSTDRKRLRELAVAGLVVAWGAFMVFVTALQVLAVSRTDPRFALANYWPDLFTVLYLAAGVLLAMRSRWSILLFAAHLVCTVGLGAFYYVEDLHSMGSVLYGGASTGLIIYYAIYLLGQGRLR